MDEEVAVRDAEAMRRAIELSARGLGRTNPNPVVGAVVLDGTGELVGEGWHERAGDAHAEVGALRAAGERARGGSVLVTLEPCRHTGRTGPCTEALLTAGVSRVVYAVGDPTGGGAEQLRAAGVRLDGGLLADEAEGVNEAWLTAARRGRSHVTWKYAATLDGRTAAADGSSRWITGGAARADGHLLRAHADAVMVGVGTVLADDPQLTVRGLGWPRQPTRVVVDSTGRTPPTARVADDAAPTVVATTEHGVARLGDTGPRKADVLVVDAGPDGRVDPSALLAALYDRELPALLVEGGATLAGTLLRASLIDRVVAYLAPALLGGDGLPVLAGTGAATVDDAWRLRLDDVARVGDDVRVTARPERGR